MAQDRRDGWHTRRDQDVQGAIFWYGIACCERNVHSPKCRILAIYPCDRLRKTAWIIGTATSTRWSKALSPQVCLYMCVCMCVLCKSLCSYVQVNALLIKCRLSRFHFPLVLISPMSLCEIAMLLDLEDVLTLIPDRPLFSTSASRHCYHLRWTTLISTHHACQWECVSQRLEKPILDGLWSMNTIQYNTIQYNTNESVLIEPFLSEGPWWTEHENSHDIQSVPGCQMGPWP